MTTATAPATAAATAGELPRLRIAVADDERDTRQFFQELLPHLGHEVVALAENGRQLIDRCRTATPDLIITDIRMPDMDGMQAAAELNRDRPVPVILVSGYHDADLLARASADHVMAYLVKPVKPVDVQAAVVMAVTRFAHLQKARHDSELLRKQLEERKTVERAKGIVSRRLRVDEDEAYRRLQRFSANHNRRLAATAQLVLDSDEIFRDLEKTDT